MMEHTTDRLFWTLTSVIVGALLLTVGIKAFPNVASSALAPVQGVMKQADIGTKNADRADTQIIDDALGKTSGNSTDKSDNNNKNQTDAQDKANAVEASRLGFTIEDNKNGTATIRDYNKANGSNVTIPKYVKNNGTLLKITNIRDYAFNDKQLTSVTIPNSVTNIGSTAFYNNKLTSIIIPNSVKNIGDFSFSSNDLTSVTIPNSVTNIAMDAFTKNANLKSVNIPNSNAYQSAKSGLGAFDPSVTITNNPSSN